MGAVSSRLDDGAAIHLRDQSRRERSSLFIPGLPLIFCSHYLFSNHQKFARSSPEHLFEQLPCLEDRCDPRRARQWFDRIRPGTSFRSPLSTIQIMTDSSACRILKRRPLAPQISCLNLRMTKSSRSTSHFSYGNHSRLRMAVLEHSPTALAQQIQPFPASHGFLHLQHEKWKT